MSGDSQLQPSDSTKLNSQLEREADEEKRFWKIERDKNSTEKHSLFTLPIQKPDSDEKEYRLIKLNNGLEVLLVHDAKTDKAAACLNVKVGSCHDPDDMPGLAHFCEHMLFLGTEKYPDEKEYSNYIENHNGVWNAYTSMSNTCYQFSVTTGALEGALDRFSAFFHCPLFTPSATARQVSAVDSEYKMYLQEDNWREFHVEKALMDPKNPISKFNVGNTFTLLTPLNTKTTETDSKDFSKEQAGMEARTRLIKWWERWYCATNMSLVLISNESLDKLQLFAKAYFSLIPDRGFGSVHRISEYPFKKENSGTIIYVKAVKDICSLSLRFPIPFSGELWRSKPHELMAALLSNKCPGSIYALLKENGWVSNSHGGCSANARDLSNGVSQLIIEIDLTKDGLAHYKEVIGFCIHYLHLLKNTPTPDWFLKEIQAMALVNFKYSEEVNVYRNSAILAELMEMPAPRKFILSSPKLFWEHNEQLYRSILKELTIENCQIFIVAKDLDKLGIEGLWEKEKWFGTEFKSVKVEEKDFQKINTKTNHKLALPHPCELIPKNFNVFDGRPGEPPLEHPLSLKKTPNSEVWFKCDDQFHIPKAEIRVEILSPIVPRFIENQVMTLLYGEIVQDNLKELTFEAQRAGMFLQFFSGNKGFGVWVNGYEDKLSDFLQEVLNKLKNQNITEEKLALSKEEVQKQLQNFLYQRSGGLSNFYLTLLFSKGCNDKKDMLPLVEKISVEDLKQFAKSFFSKFHMRILINGSISKQAATYISNQTERTMEADKHALTPADVLSIASLSHLIPKSCNLILEVPVQNPNEVNSAITYFCKMGDISNPKDRVLAKLSRQILHDAAFYTLRTKEELGYIVRANVVEGTEFVGVSIVVQSAKHPKFLESRIIAFLRKMKEELLNMADNVFKEHKESLRSSWTEKLKNIRDETNRFWMHITNGYLDFRQYSQDCYLLEKITKDELLSAFSTCIDPGASQRSKLSVHVISSTLKTAPHGIDLGQNITYIENIKAFKEQLPISSAPQPVNEFAEMLKHSSNL